MIYFIADIHADAIKWLSKKTNPVTKEFTANDTLIVCGDCGIPWYNPELKFYDTWTKPGSEKQEHYQLSWLNNQKYKTIFLAGNHDNYDLIKQMPETTISGFETVRQMCYQNKFYDNIYYVDRPQYLFLEGKKLFFISGADSHDADILFEPDEEAKQYIKVYNKRHWKGEDSPSYRINHFSWWEDERVDEQEAIRLANLYGENIDCVVTHAPPAIVHEQWKPCGAPGRLQPSPSEKSLERVRQQIEYKAWIPGHLHEEINTVMHDIIGIYHRIYSLEDIYNITKSNKEKRDYYKNLLN